MCEACPSPWPILALGIAVGCWGCLVGIGVWAGWVLVQRVGDERDDDG